MVYSGGAPAPISAKPTAASMNDFNIGMLLLALEISFALIAHDRDQIAHREIGVDEMQAPVLEHFSIHDHIARYVIGARTTRRGMNRHRQIGAMLIGHALRA